MFLYDELNRSKTKKLTTNGMTLTDNYVYDELGNIITKPLVGTYICDSSISTQLKYISGSKNYSFTYDKRGNVEKDGSRNFYYTAFDKPYSD